MNMGYNLFKQSLREYFVDYKTKFWRVTIELLQHFTSIKSHRLPPTFSGWAGISTFMLKRLLVTSKGQIPQCHLDTNILHSLHNNKDNQVFLG